MNGAKYRKIDEHLLQSTQEFSLGRCFSFRPDNYPKHTAKTPQKWLRDKSLNVRVAQPEPGLEWEKLPKYRCAKLVASYPRRLEAVIAAKGASTKY